MTNFVANAPFDYPTFLAESSLTEFFDEAVPTTGTGTSFGLTNTFVENNQQITEQLTFTGTFANYVDGYPTTGSITAMTYTSTVGTSFTFTSVAMTVEVFTGYVQAGNLEALMVDLLAGNDSVTGSGGADVLVAYAGHDALRGNEGNDSLSGGAGDDFLVGGAGDDLISGGDGIDRVSLFDDGTGGFGITVDLRIEGVAQNFGPLGSDTLSSIEHVTTTYNDDTVNGNESANWIWTFMGLDTLYGHGGDDLFTVGQGTKIIDGGAGSDTVEIDDQAWAPLYTAAGITVSLELQGQAQATGVGNWTLTGIENLSGNYGSDEFTGDANANYLAGFSGDDTLNGRGGNDILMGDGAIVIGYDEASPGAMAFIADLSTAGFTITPGNDILNGGAGNDTLYGDGGFDTAVFSGNSSAYSWSVVGGVTQIEGLDGSDSLHGIERMEFANASYEFGPSGFAAPAVAIAGFGAGASGGGWSSNNTYPRTLADVDGDGRTDVVGFGDGGVTVALATGSGQFGNAFLAFGGFGAGASAGGWSSNDLYPRSLADINGDGKADIVGFGDGGVTAALATSGGGFGAAFLAVGGFGAGASAGSWTNATLYPRMFADVNGDGMDDVVGFGDGGVTVALAAGGGSFGAAFLGIAGFGAGASAGGWSDNDVYTRTLADINGDGRADIVGFGSGGVQIAFARSDGTFVDPFFAFAGFGAEPSAGGWTSNNLYYRTVGDLDGDGHADLVGFGDGGVFAAYGDGTGQFATAELIVAGFGAGASAGGWTSQDLYPRMLADLNGDGADDIVGFGDGGVIAATSVSDWVLV